jgi:NADH-quinone oxidoreductase subunit M
MNLSLLILVPLITAIAVLLMHNQRQVKWVSLIGASVQIIICLFLFVYYRNEVADGNTSQMLFQQQYEWFPALHIFYHVGVDGISVVLILFTAFVVLAGIFV